MNAPSQLDPLDRYSPLFAEPDLDIGSLGRRRSHMRRRRAIVGGATATATVAAVVGVLTLATPSGTRQTELSAADANAASTLPSSEDAPSTVPVLVSVCISIDDEVAGTEEDLPIEGGTFARERGTIVTGAIDSADPRLGGTYFSVLDADWYAGAADEFIAQIHAVTVRIENGEGSWQGSNIGFNSPDFVESGPEGPFVLTGDGAYEGSTAVLVETPGPASCSLTLGGMIIVDGFLEPPAPPPGG